MSILRHVQQFPTANHESMRFVLDEATPFGDDPMDDDAPEDGLIVTSYRRLQRLAIVAAETGSRFAREAIGHDPVAWLMAPRQLFEGRPAIEACMDRSNFDRAIVLHGLSLGLDARPGDIDDLLGDDDRDDDGHAVVVGLDDGEINDAYGRSSGRDWRTCRTGAEPNGRRLFTATIVDEQASGTLQAFHAGIERNEAAFAERLYARMGARSAGLAVIRAGFDPVDPFVGSMVSEAMADMLRLIDEAPASPLAQGLDVRIEQRFAA